MEFQEGPCPPGPPLGYKSAVSVCVALMCYTMVTLTGTFLLRTSTVLLGAGDLQSPTLCQPAIFLASIEQVYCL